MRFFLIYICNCPQVPNAVPQFFQKCASPNVASVASCSQCIWRARCGATDLLVYHEKNAPLEAGYCIHNGGKFKLLIKTVVPGYPTQLPGSGSTGPMTSGPGYPDPGGKPSKKSMQSLLHIL